MTLSMQSGATPNELHCPKWDAAIVGQRVDDRGGASYTFLSGMVEAVSSLQHNVAQATLTFNEKVIGPDSLADELETFRSSSIILDATTLGFVEVMLCCRAIRDLGIGNFSILYTEPARYQ